MQHVEEQTGARSDSAIKVTRLFVTIASLTERGGRITKATSGLTVAGLALARVGDVVTYQSGSEAVTTDSPERDGMASSIVFTVVKRSTVTGLTGNA